MRFQKKRLAELKKSTDPRHLARRFALQVLFGWHFVSQDLDKTYKDHLERIQEDADIIRANQKDDILTKAFDQKLAKDLIFGTVENQGEIDKIITQAATQWPLDQISLVDLSILRIAIYELKFKKSLPKVAIDEAVELGKEFGSEPSPKFINGVLGTVVEENSKRKAQSAKLQLKS